MAVRPTWKGYLKVSLVTIPVKVYPATESAATLSFNHVALTDEQGGRLIEEVSLEIPPDAHLVVVGSGNSGKDAIGNLLGRLVQPTGGQLRYGDQDLTMLPEAATGRRFSYVGEESFMFPQSLRENLVYGLKHRPLRPARYEGESLKEYERRTREAIRSGNPPFDTGADYQTYVDGKKREAGVRSFLGARQRTRAPVPVKEPLSALHSNVRSSGRVSRSSMTAVRSSSSPASARAGFAVIDTITGGTFPAVRNRPAPDQAPTVDPCAARACQK